ncbi:MAG: hypothetical protein ABIQ31_07730 [Ferruginibacter sp.]
MQTLFIPLVIILTPITILFFLLRYFKKSKTISTSLKIVLGFAFAIIGLLTSFYAMIASIAGMSQNGIRCATGAAFFIPLGFLVNIIGIPLLLVLFKSANSKTVHI